MSLVLLGSGRSLVQRGAHPLKSDASRDTMIKFSPRMLFLGLSLFSVGNSLSF